MDRPIRARLLVLDVSSMSFALFPGEGMKRGGQDSEHVETDFVPFLEPSGLLFWLETVESWLVCWSAGPHAVGRLVCDSTHLTLASSFSNGEKNSWGLYVNPSAATMSSIAGHGKA